MLKTLAITAIVFVSLNAHSTEEFGYSVLTGRVNHVRVSGSAERMAMAAIYCFATRLGSDNETLSFRTWETEPAGWYRMSGGAGSYTAVFSTPSHFMRPIVRTNLSGNAGDEINLNVSPHFDYAMFDEHDYDRVAAIEYFQPFVAAGASVTQVGFKLAHDGVDGIGPGKQNFLVSIHRAGRGTPEQWKQIGPTAVVVDVDCGGPKNYTWTAGWNSGEVPLTPGETYAVRLRTEEPNGKVQAFWRTTDEKKSWCYRVTHPGVVKSPETGLVSKELWMAVSTDGDGLVIPYNKRVAKPFNQLTSCKKKWSQTYVASGNGLASVILYAAVSGAQPQLSRQRVKVRICEGKPGGEQVGCEKIAVGSGDYTGDASWGVFGVAFAPGEVSLVPGNTYAIEWESIENYETLHGFVNIKGQISNDLPGINPYRKHPRDDYKKGTAFLDGKDVGFDLDMQVIEYQSNSIFRSSAFVQEGVSSPRANLIVNGDMELIENGSVNGWQRFAIDSDTTTQSASERGREANHVAQVVGGSVNKKTVDGGFVQHVVGVSPADAYVLSGKVRCTWPVDDKHQCMIGYDPTGQTENPKADTIAWKTYPDLHGIFVETASIPIRPRKDAISIWLRARTTHRDGPPFRADFDDFELRRVETEPHAKAQRR